MTSHNPPTTQQLDDIETRARAATDGPWTVELEQCDCSDGYCHHGTYVSAIYAADGERRTELGDFPDADWQFTIHARTDVPLLLAEVRRLNAELATERRQHEFTMRQRNERSVRLLHLRDLAEAGDTEALLAAARDVLAASANDHTPAAGSV